jgi:hypothetical protein
MGFKIIGTVETEAGPVGLAQYEQEQEKATEAEQEPEAAAAEKAAIDWNDFPQVVIPKDNGDLMDVLTLAPDASHRMRYTRYDVERARRTGYHAGYECGTGVKIAEVLAAIIVAAAFTILVGFFG